MELIKSKERVQKYGEVFTPQWVVEKMCDELSDEAWKPETTFLEPSCGEGIFILEILRRKFENCKTRKDYRTALKSVYGFEIQADNVKITIENVINLCKKYFKISQSDIEIINDHIIMCDGLKIMRMLNEEQKQTETGKTAQATGNKEGQAVQPVDSEILQHDRGV